MAKEEYYIAVRTNPSGSEYTFKKVNGSKLNKDYFAYQSDIKGRGWSITEIKSGVSIKLKLPTLKACKEYLANLTDEDHARIEETHKSEKYQKMCQDLADFKTNANDELHQDFPDPED